MSSTLIWERKRTLKLGLKLVKEFKIGKEFKRIPHKYGNI